MQTLGPHQLRYATSWNISHLILHKFWVSNGSIKLKIADTTEFILTTTMWKNYFLVTKLTNFYWNQSEMITFSSLVFIILMIFVGFTCNSATFQQISAILQLFAIMYTFLFYKSYKSHSWSSTFFMCNVICIVLSSTR